jgi:hypothetical protein
MITGCKECLFKGCSFILDVCVEREEADVPHALLPGQHRLCPEFR